MVTRTLSCLALSLWAAPAVADCRLALLLAMDISSSVDASEDALQRQGLARALVSPEVIDAIFSAPGSSVALAVYEWSGRYQQDMILDWVTLDSVTDVQSAATVIGDSRRNYADFPTAMGYSIGYAADVFKRAPICWQQTLDISGDGVNNEGFKPRIAYKHFPLKEVTVNGLTIGGQADDLAGYYQREVIKGPGSFVEEAFDFSDFERAMQRKLVRELQARAIGMLVVDR